MALGSSLDCVRHCWPAGCHSQFSSTQITICGLWLTAHWHGQRCRTYHEPRYCRALSRGPCLDHTGCLRRKAHHSAQQSCRSMTSAWCSQHTPAQAHSALGLALTLNRSAACADCTSASGLACHTAKAYMCITPHMKGVAYELCPVCQLKPIKAAC